MKKRFRRGLKAIAEWCQENRHLPVDEQQKALNTKLRGHYRWESRRRQGGLNAHEAGNGG